MKRTFILLALVPSLICAEESTYQNPVDGSKYKADWKTYQPQGGIIDQSHRVVEMKNTRLLSTQQAFSNNVTIKELAEFVKDTQTNIENSIGTPSSNFELLVETTLTKDKAPEFKIASQGTVSTETLQKIYDGFKKLKDFRSKEDPLKYQVLYEIKQKS